MKINVVYPVKFANVFKEWSKAIADCLRILDHEVNIQNSINFDSCDVEIIQCPIIFEKFEKKHYKKYVMVQGEQFPTFQCSSKWQMDKWKRISSFLNLYDVVWDTYQPLHKHLYEGIIPSIHYKMGYHTLFDKFKDTKQKINTSFFGTMNDRRNEICKKIGNVTVNQYVMDQERDDFINQSKINLNVHYSESKLLQTLRILYCGCSKGFIISEDFIGDDDLRDQMVNVSAEELPGTVQYFLENDDKRKLLRESLYEYLRTDRTMLQGIKHCIENI